MDIICAACSSQIVDRFMLKALGKFWHEDCLKVSFFLSKEFLLNFR